MAITYSPLWKTLSNKNMNREDLKKLTNLSPSTMAKMSKDEYVALRVIDDICKALQVKSIIEIVEFANNNSTTLDDIEYVINKLSNNKHNDTKPDDKDIFLLYLTMEEFITNEMKEESKDNSDKFLSLYSKCFKEKLLPQDLLDAINDLLKIQLF